MGVNEILSALADETARKIIYKLKEGKISSGDLASALEMSPQALSYHLSKLKRAEIIYETKYKNFIYYELDLSVLDEVAVWIDGLKGGHINEKQQNESGLHHSDTIALCGDGGSSADTP
ncbi:MAG: metalloregulator ArsR/SmtB family transcription factor [Oscillospiraceae bacterium]